MDLDLTSKAERLAEEAQQYEAFSAINLRHVRGEVSEALTHFGRLGLLEEYTKHDISHIDTMLGMYDWIIPENTLAIMTPADWLLTTLATYFHDFGLLVTRAEFDAREDLSAYVTHRRRIMENDDPSVMDYRSQVKQWGSSTAEEFLYQEFVRTYHAQRIKGWLDDTPDATWGGDRLVIERLHSVLGSIEETFKEDVGLVCESHHLDDINDVKKYPLNKPYGRTREEEANVQYSAFLLRTADLFHITKDRVPSMAALIINPRNPKSQVEWSKQKSVRSVRPRIPAKASDAGDAVPPPDTVEVHATFKEAEGFFGLTAYLQYAGKQLGQTFEWSKENQINGVSSYIFPWRRIDVSHIEAKGFVAEPFEFTIDQGKILDLLTGHTLYNDTGVVVRELVQNSLDAVRLQEYQSDAPFTPRIDVSWDSNERTLSVVDNGVGMTQRVIEKNFLRVGSSRYQDPEFLKEFPDFSSISRFGIGVLSTFMVADDVAVSTNHESEKQARQLSLRDVHGQYLVRLVDKQSDQIPQEIRDHGTSVRLKLRPSAQLSAIRDVLRYWVVFPNCEVSLSIDGGTPERIGFDSVERALKESLVSAHLAREDDTGLRTVYGAPLEIRTVKESGLEIAFAVYWSRWLEEWGYVRVDPNHAFDEAQPPVFGICVGGIRVTTDPPGFKMGGIAAMANASGKGAPRTNVARSAIEKTEEYDDLLHRVYAAYLGHITNEMDAQESSRAASLTRAAQEAAYLAQDIARYEAESIDFRDNELRTIPAIIVEQDGVRSRLSLKELETWSELSSIESTTISSFENVLRSVRGAGSASLRNLLDLMGNGEVLPDVPLICGLGGTGLFSRMFTSEWEVVRLETDDESRTLRTSWQRRGESPRWQAAGRPDVLPSTVAARMQREAAIGRGRSIESLRLIQFPRVTEIETTGFQQRLVLCQGRLLILPGHPLLDIKATSPQIPEAARLWCIGWLISTITFDSSRGRFRSSDMDVNEFSSSQGLSGIIENMRSLGVLEVLDEASLRTVLTEGEFEVLDVQRWDQRFSPQ
jgi:molecular chaperone HtpG